MASTNQVSEMIDRALKGSAPEGPGNAVESFYDAIGMMRGPNAPMYRALFNFTVVGGILYATKPAFAFEPNGQARPWKALDPNNKSATSLPWFMLPFGAAVIGGVFI